MLLSLLPVNRCTGRLVDWFDKADEVADVEGAPGAAVEVAMMRPKCK